MISRLVVQVRRSVAKRKQSWRRNRDCV